MKSFASLKLKGESLKLFEKMTKSPRYSKKCEKIVKDGEEIYKKIKQ